MRTAVLLSAFESLCLSATRTRATAAVLVAAADTNFAIIAGAVMCGAVPDAFLLLVVPPVTHYDVVHRFGWVIVAAAHANV